MIFMINPHLVAMQVKKEAPFVKYQFYTMDDARTRICTILSEGDKQTNVDEYNVNIRSKLNHNAPTSEPEILIRSTHRNQFDSNLIIAAIPFKGKLLPTVPVNYRFRYAKVIEYDRSKNETVTFPTGLRYINVEKGNDIDMYQTADKILYCILEPNLSVLQKDNNERFCEEISINIPFTYRTKASKNAAIELNLFAFLRDGENVTNAKDDYSSIWGNNTYLEGGFFAKKEYETEESLDDMGVPYEVYCGTVSKPKATGNKVHEKSYTKGSKPSRFKNTDSDTASSSNGTYKKPSYNQSSKPYNKKGEYGYKNGKGKSYGKSDKKSYGKKQYSNKKY